MDAVFARLGEQVVRHRKAVIGLWLLAVVLAALFAPRVSGKLRVNAHIPGLESEKVDLLLERGFKGKAAYSVVAILTSETRTVDDPEYEEAAGALQFALTSVPKVEQTTGYYDTFDEGMVAGDGKSALVVVSLDAGDPVEAAAIVPKVRRAIGSTELPDWLKVYVTGGPAVWHDVTQLSSRDLTEAEARALPAVLVVLLLAFGSPVAALLPLILGFFAAVVTMGLVYFIAQVVPMSIFVQNAATMIGFGVGIDYALFLISRFREELGAGNPGQAAAALVLPTAGKAVFFSGLTVLIGLGAPYFLVNHPGLKSLALGSMLVVSFAILGALTLLPAMLSFIGRRINWPRPTVVVTATPAEGGGVSPSGGCSPATRSVWERWAAQVMRRPVVFFLVSLAVLVALSYPATNIVVWSPGVSSVPGEVESRRGFDLLSKHFTAGNESPVQIVGEAPPGTMLHPKVIGKLFQLSRTLREDPRVARVESIVDVDPNLTLEDYQKLYGEPEFASSGNIFAGIVGGFVNLGDDSSLSVVRVTPRSAADDLRTRALVRELRGDILPALAEEGVLRFYVGGETALGIDLADVSRKAFPRIALAIFVATYLVLLLSFRSVLIPVKSILMNTLAVLASYGVLVLVFQEGVGSKLLSFTPPGSLDPEVLLILFCVLFGLSMDYEVFLLSRVREEYDKIGTNEESVARGLGSTASIITSAALIMVAVFGSFALTRLVVIKQLGLGLAVAVFLDATLIRVILVPSTMRLLGRWNWWLPAKLARSRWLGRSTVG